jgi:hypothetical protein
LIGRAEYTKTFPSPYNFTSGLGWLVFQETSARLSGSTMKNNNGGTMRLETLVDFRIGKSSALAAAFPTVARYRPLCFGNRSCIANLYFWCLQYVVRSSTPTSILVPAVDLYGEVLSWRYSLPGEMGGSSLTQPVNLALDSTIGFVCVVNNLQIGTGAHSFHAES